MGTQNKHEYDVFILFAEEDAAWVTDFLIKKLENVGLKTKTPNHFRLGVPELGEFEHFIEHSKRTLIIVSPAYQKNNLLDFVDTLAQKHGHETGTWPVIPFLLHKTHLEPRLAGLTKIDATNPDNWEVAIERLCQELQTNLPEVKLEIPKCPYPGMRAFETEDRPHFFGRKAEIERLVNQLKQSTICAVIGPSGCGKSSLVKAGLIPYLKKSNLFENAKWLIEVIRPGGTPLKTLSEALEIYNISANSNSIISAKQRILLVVDQLEEIFILKKNQQILFFNRLIELSKGPYFYVVVTLRADFYADLIESNLWSVVQYNKMEIASLGESGLREAIREPAKQVGVYIESALVERLVSDAEGGNSILPFLQETMHLLWNKLEKRYLSTNEYDSLILPYRDTYDSGVSGLEIVMSNQADKTISGLSEIQQKIARRVFLQLIHFGERKLYTRRQEYLAELKIQKDKPEDFNIVIDTLSQNRLITIDKDKENKSVVDIPHESLITGWGTLREWISRNVEKEKIKRIIYLRTQNWLNTEKSNIALLSNEEILRIEEATKGYPNFFSSLNKNNFDYIKESKANNNPGFNLPGILIIILIFLAFSFAYFNFLYFIKTNNLPSFYKNFSNYFAVLIPLLVILISIFHYKDNKYYLQKFSFYIAQKKFRMVKLISLCLTIIIISEAMVFNSRKIEVDCNKYDLSSNSIFSVNYAIENKNLDIEETEVFKSTLQREFRENVSIKELGRNIIDKCKAYIDRVLILDKTKNDIFQIKEEGDYIIPKKDEPLLIKGSDCLKYYEGGTKVLDYIGINYQEINFTEHDENSCSSILELLNKGSNT